MKTLRTLVMRFASLLPLVPLGALAGALAGALLNVLNNHVCPDCLGGVAPFIGTMSAPYGTKVIFQGAFEGGLIGGASAFWFAVVVAWVSRLRFSWRDAARYLWAGILAGVLSCLADGVDGILIAYFRPDFFAGTPLAEIPRLGWVLGSIWGGYIGGLFSWIVVCMLFSRNWTARRVEKTAGGS